MSNKCVITYFDFASATKDFRNLYNFFWARSPPIQLVNIFLKHPVYKIYDQWACVLMHDALNAHCGIKLWFGPPHGGDIFVQCVRLVSTQQCEEYELVQA